MSNVNKLMKQLGLKDGAKSDEKNPDKHSDGKGKGFNKPGFAEVKRSNFRSSGRGR